MLAVGSRLCAELSKLAVPLLFACASAAAGEPTSSAVIDVGRSLLQENGCNGACHSGRVNGADPSVLYTRTTRMVNSREELRHQVEVCVSRLSSQIFPEDIESVAAALDHDFYQLE